MVGWRNSIAVAWKRFPSADSFQPSVGTTARLKPQMPRVFPGKVKLEMDCTATSQHFFKVYIYIPRTGLVPVLNEGIAFAINENCNVKIRPVVKKRSLTVFGDI